MHSTVPIRTTQKTTTTKKKKEIPTDESLVVVHIFVSSSAVISAYISRVNKRIRSDQSVNCRFSIFLFMICVQKYCIVFSSHHCVLLTCRSLTIKNHVPGERQKVCGSSVHRAFRQLYEEKHEHEFSLPGDGANMFHRKKCAASACHASTCIQQARQVVHLSAKNQLCALGELAGQGSQH